jgi:hypothetical protein
MANIIFTTKDRKYPTIEYISWDIVDEEDNGLYLTVTVKGQPHYVAKLSDSIELLGNLGNFKKFLKVDEKGKIIIT